MLSETVYDAQWVDPPTFSEILVNQSMLAHHTTDNIAAALTALKKRASVH